MASPQLENGYTKIANELLEALAKSRFDMCQWAIILWVLRNSYGWNKKETDPVRVAQIVRDTQMLPAGVYKALDKLISRGVISRSASGSLSIVKDFVSWGRISPAGDKSLSPRRASPYKKEKKEMQGGDSKPLTDIQKVVEAYKALKGIAKDNKAWDRDHFNRCSRAAKVILSGCSSNCAVAVQYLTDAASFYDSKKLHWKLETVARAIGDGMKFNTVERPFVEELESTPVDPDLAL